MIDSDSETEKADDSAINKVQNQSNKSVLPREPSFLCWCDGGVIQYLDHSVDNFNASKEDLDIQLPMFQGKEPENGFIDREGLQLSKFQQRSIHLNGDHAMGNESVHTEGNGNGNGNGKYVPFNVENVPSRDTHFSDFNVDDGNSGSNLGTGQDTRSCISVSTVLRAFFYILVWYTSSTCLTLYNKSLLGDKLGKFPAPMLMNTVHFTMQAVLSKVIIKFWFQNLQPSVTMSWRDYFMRVVPTALGTALDINLSNASLVFISVTFATMCKSASPIFLLMFAFAFKLESPSIKLFGIILIISIGILLTVAKETEFEFWGFVFVMMAAVMSGFRWTMTQILLQKEAYGLKHPLTLMSYVTPVMAVATVLLSLIMDPWQDFYRNYYFNNSSHIFRSCLLMIIGGSLAFLMVLIEYILVSATSAVTVTIAGVVKEAVTILVAVFYFHDEFTFLKGIGLVTIMFGVSLFNWYKYLKLQNSQPSENEGGGFPTYKEAAKYVILENVDDQDDEILWTFANSYQW